MAASGGAGPAAHAAPGRPREPSGRPERARPRGGERATLAALGVALDAPAWQARLAASARVGVTEIVYQPAGPDIERELAAFAKMAGL